MYSWVTGLEEQKAEEVEDGDRSDRIIYFVDATTRHEGGIRNIEHHKNREHRSKGKAMKAGMLPTCIHHARYATPSIHLLHNSGTGSVIRSLPWGSLLGQNLLYEQIDCRIHDDYASLPTGCYVNSEI
jgi:hypothetical protein